MRYKQVKKWDEASEVDQGQKTSEVGDLQNPGTKAAERHVSQQ
jgi:hypothetical protein